MRGGAPKRRRPAAQTAHSKGCGEGEAPAAEASGPAAALPDATCTGKQPRPGQKRGHEDRTQEQPSKRKKAAEQLPASEDLSMQMLLPEVPTRLTLLCSLRQMVLAWTCNAAVILGNSQAL